MAKLIRNIASYAQQISDDLMRPFKRAGAFIDDLFIKHKPNATDDELINDAKLLLKRVIKFIKRIV